MNVLTCAVPIVAACVLLPTASGCQGKQQDPTATTRPTTAGTTQPATQPVRLVGVLRGGMMAIGGETTGWVLRVDDNDVHSVELDVSAVREQAEALQDRWVTVTGRKIEKKYVERGKVGVVVVETIEIAR